MFLFTYFESDLINLNTPNIAVKLISNLSIKYWNNQIMHLHLFVKGCFYWNGGVTDSGYKYIWS